MAKKDVNQLAKFISDIATGEVKDIKSQRKTDPELKGRPGGNVGGKARAQSLTPQQRSDIASKAAQKRWGNVPPPIDI